jgi:putative Mg2+ transporter-C (MgtC) family protein
MEELSIWIRVGRTVSAEFSDFGQLEQLIQLVLRIFIAGILGGLVGFEREKRGKAAGIRTHMIVCIGTALFIIVPRQAGCDFEFLSRVI